MGKLDYFFRVKEYLQSHGEEVYNATIPPFQGVEQRSEELAKIIDDILYETWSEKLHIIAHSQGGVDSRYVISALGYENKVASLITIATPHLGTPLADYVLKAPKGAFDPVSRTMGWIIGDAKVSCTFWTDATTSAKDFSLSHLCFLTMAQTAAMTSTPSAT